MTNSSIIFLLSLGLAFIYLVKLFIITKYHDLNIDQYNHNAFIKSLSTNFKIKTSAIREPNTYPFLIHMMMDKIKNKFVSKYFSFFFEIMFMLIISWYMYELGAEIQSLLSVLIILSISTTSFSQVRFFSARVFGLFLFNTILLTTSTDFALEIKILIEILCLVPIFLASKFAHQVYVLVIIPAAILFYKVDILLSYPLAFAFAYILTKGFVVDIVRSHVFHCYWSFFNHMDYYVYGRYYREFEEEKVERNEFSLKRAARNLFSVIKNPVLILIPILFIFSFDVQLNFNVGTIIIVLGIFLVLALYSRLNRSIGESGRYFDYILVPLVLALYNAGILETSWFYSILIFAYIASFLWISALIKRENKSLRVGGRVFDNEPAIELMNFLRELPKSKIASLPISISNYLAANSRHTYFYPYSYFAQTYLQRVGILPFFKFDDKNLLNKKYVDYLVVDSRQISEDYLVQIIKRYRYSLIFQNSTYQVYKKVK